MADVADMPGAEEVATFEKNTEGVPTAVEAEYAGGSPAAAKAKRPCAKVLDRNKRALEGGCKGTVSYSRGAFYNLEPATDFEKQNIFGVVFGPDP